MSEIVGNRPPEEINTQENEQIYTELPADVFAENDRETASSKEILVNTADVAVTGLRARLAERRANRTVNKVVDTAHKLVRVNHYNERAKSPYAARRGTEDRPVSAVDPRPRNRSDIRQSKRFDKAAQKKMRADIFATSVTDTFGSVDTIKRSGALTKPERRRAKREINKQRRKGYLSAQDARIEKLRVDAAPLRLDLPAKRISDKLQKKASAKIESHADRPFTEKILGRRYEHTADAVNKNIAKADHLAEQRAAKQADLEAKKQNREHSFKDPEYYFDTTNILSLKDNIADEADRRYSQAIASAIGRGEDGSDVSRDQIESNTELEGIARYFGFKSWREAEEKVPGWLMNAVINMYGMSADELLEFEAPVLRSPNRDTHTPIELEHDESINLSARSEVESDTDDESAEDEQYQRAVNFFAEMAKPENRPGLYDNEIASVAAEIEDQLEELLSGITDPAEKRQIIDQVYTEQIANLLTIPSEKLKDPDVVPAELTNQILADIKKARKDILEIKQSQEKVEPSNPTPEVKKAIYIPWESALDPKSVMKFRKNRDSIVKGMKEDYIAKTGGKFTPEMREDAIMQVEATLLPGYLRIDNLDDIDLSDEQSRENLDQLRDMLSMEWSDLQDEATNNEERAKRAVADNARRTALDL